MKTKIYRLFATLLFLNYCSAPSYLPKSENLDVSRYGSYITVKQKDQPTVKGELIAIDRAKMVVLIDQKSEESKANNSYSNIPLYKQKVVELQLKNIYGFTLSYAQPVDYSWSILVYTLLSVSHGFFGIFSLPINLIVTISVNAGGTLSYQYSQKDMTFEKLKMFARFPQGIPSGINLKDIKR